VNLQCHQCATLNPPAAKFCCECGSRLNRSAEESQSGGPLEISWLGKDADLERRQLTIVFCDLVGMTEFASTLDPEDLRELIAGYHRCVGEIVERHSGFIAQYLGDGILAYFGYPKASEDDAERAIRASLEITQAVPQLEIRHGQLHTRVGIATGLTVISELTASGGQRERSATGETPNMAARLQALAPRDGVLIAPLTRRLVGDQFEYHDFGSVTLKGFSQPVQVTQVLSERKPENRFRALHATSSPLVGRAEEYATIQRLWKAGSDGIGNAILITGEPGIGKSRLVATLEDDIAAAPHTKLRFVCSPQYSGSTLRPVIHQLERLAGFQAGDTPEQQLQKLEAVMTPAIDNPADIALIAELLSLPQHTPPPPLPLPDKRTRILAVLARLIVSHARATPALILWDDVHWIDPTSLSLLDELVGKIAGLPILLVISSRPGFLPSWRYQPNVTTIRLERLAESHSIALVTELASGKALPRELIDQIIQRTDGVPLFIEELIRTIFESGLVAERSGQFVLTGALPDFAVPDTLQASLMARIDRLASGREVAQIGAAIGRDFSFDLILAVTGLEREKLKEALARLSEADLIAPLGDHPEAGYSFKHALVQNAAYSTLLREKRRQIHARIADTFERAFRSVVEAQPEIIGQHFAYAEAWSRAVDYFLKASNLALHRSAAAEAAQHAGKGLSMLSSLTEAENRERFELGLQLTLGRAMIVLRGEFAGETGAAFLRARELCDGPDNREVLIEVLDGLCVHHFSRRELDSTITVSRELLVIGQQKQQRQAIITGLRALGSASFLKGEFAQSCRSFERLLHLYDPVIDSDLALRTRADPQVSCLAYLSLCKLIQGDFQQSLHCSDQSHTAARMQPHAGSLVVALRLALFRSALLEDWAQLLSHANEFWRTAEKHHLPLAEHEAKFFAEWARLRLGQPSSGLAGMRESLHAFSAGRPVWPFFLAALGTAEAFSARPIDAQKSFKLALDVAHRHGEHWYTPEIMRQMADAHLCKAPSDYEWVERQLHESGDCARRYKAPLWVLRASLSIARLWERTGRGAEAARLLREVYDRFPSKQMDMPDTRAAREFFTQLH
jgi:class 3 adenylate cyclase/tetratricopeptide (TPR) repeat protein